MRAIYETKGKAKEYCELALNLYAGCVNGCIYCYVPKILRKTREEFLKAQPRWEAIDQLKKEVSKYKNRTVFLCFASDPYPLLQNPITTAALEILLSNGVNVEILTKAGMRSTQDFDLLKQYKDQVNYGATLTFLYAGDSMKYEPLAAYPEERISALFVAKDNLGLKTWVSLEPVIKPEETLALIDKTWPFVDEYRVGKLNYFPLPESVDWTSFLIRAIDKFKSYGVKYLIKDSLKPYLKEKGGTR